MPPVPNDTPFDPNAWMLLADRILQHLYGGNKTGYTVEEVAEALNSPAEEVLIAAHNILESGRPYLSQRHLGTVTKQYQGIIQQPSHGIANSVRVFLAQGGFTEIHRTIQAELEQKARQQNRAEQLTDLQISELLRLPEDSKITRRQTHWSIIIALLSLLVAIGSFFQTCNKGN